MKLYSTLLFILAVLNSSQLCHAVARGVLGRDVRLWWIVPKEEYRWDGGVLNAIRIAIGNIRDGGPTVFFGRNQEVVEVKSEWLGVIFFAIRLSYANMQAHQIGQDLQDYLLTWGEVPYTVWNKAIQEHQQAKPKLAKPDAIPTKTDNNATRIVHKREYTPHDKESPRPPWTNAPAVGPEEDEDRLPATAAPSYSQPDYEIEYNDDPPGYESLNAVDVWDEPFEEMRTLSIPPGSKLDDLTGFYYKRRYRNGQNVDVYIVDTGFELHPETLFMKEVVQYRVNLFDGSGTRDSIEFNKHGLAVASKIAGQRVGTAANASFLLIGCVGDDHWLTTAHWFMGLVKTYDTIRKRQTIGLSPPPSVVNLSWNFDVLDRDDPRTPNLFDPCAYGVFSETCVPALVAIKKLSESFMKAFDQLGNVIVVVAGGSRDASKPVTSPASEQEIYPKTVVAVGAAAPDGTRRWQTSKSMKIWAPGTNVHVADYDTKDSPVLSPRDGSDLAAVTVTGMIATFMSEGVPVTDVISHLYRLAHIRGDPRNPLSVPIAFNGISRAEWPTLLHDENEIEKYAMDPWYHYS